MVDVGIDPLMHLDFIRDAGQQSSSQSSMQSTWWANHNGNIPGAAVPQLRISMALVSMNMKRPRNNIRRLFIVENCRTQPNLLLSTEIALLLALLFFFFWTCPVIY
jgi:hypothetical protein